MKKKPAIVMYQYKATVTRTVDGDTIIASTSLGFDVYKNVDIRLADINAPELSTPEGVKSAAYLKNLIEGKTIYFNSKKYDKYKRSIAEIFLDNIEGATSVNAMIVAAGMAVSKHYK
jgi:micrococcal nuclease